MKIKIDFVTNSSSTSFTVAWPVRIVTIDHVSKYVTPYEKAKRVYLDAQNQKPRKIKATKSVFQIIHREFADDYGSFYDSYDRIAKREGVTEHDIVMNPLWSASAWEEQRLLVEGSAADRASDFIKKYEGHYLYLFEYGDEDGSFMSDMEHGDTFKSVPHIAISKH